MSRSFARFFRPFFNFHTPEPLSPEMNKLVGNVVATISISGLIGHGIYAFCTAENKIIKVTNKYQFDRNGFTEFIIIDENGKHYNVNNSIWYWKWDSIEDWHNIPMNKELVIKYYGWRVPLLGLFPNIIMSKQDKVLDSMSRAQYIITESNYNKFKPRDEEKLNLSKEEKDAIQVSSLNPYYNLLKHVKLF